MGSLIHCRVAVCGDYHTLPEAQKSLVDLLRRASTVSGDKKRHRWVLALEMLRPEDDRPTREFLTGRLNEDEYLTAIDFRRRWGFPWEQYRHFFYWAREAGVPVVGINSGAAGLKQRDVFAADRLAKLTRRYRGATICAIIGDFHLAKKHLPAQLRRAVPALRKPGAIVSVHQNLESAYWQLREKGVSPGGQVAGIGPDSFCLFNAAPWIKVRSHLRWLDMQEEDDVHFHIAQANRDALGEWITCSEEDVWELQQVLLEFLGVSLAPDPELQVFAVDDASRWEKHLPKLRGKKARERMQRWMELQRGFGAGLTRTLVIASNAHADYAFWAAWALLPRLGFPVLDPLSPETNSATLRWYYALAALGARIVDPGRELPAETTDAPAREAGLRRAELARRDGEVLGARLYDAVTEGRIFSEELLLWYQGDRPTRTRLAELTRPLPRKRAAA